MPRRLALIATSLALVVVLVGCGSDDDSADARDTTTTTEEDEDATTTEGDDETEGSTVPEETTESSEPSETTEGDATSTPSIDIPEGADFCTAYGAFDESAEELLSDTLEDIRAATAALRDGIAQLAAITPDELADDMAVLVDATEELADAAAEATTTEEAQAALTDVFSNEEFSAAAERIDTYFDETCPQADDDADTED